MNEKDALLKANEALREARQAVEKALDWYASDDDKDEAIRDALALLNAAKQYRHAARMAHFKETNG